MPSTVTLSVLTCVAALAVLAAACSSSSLHTVGTVSPSCSGSNSGGDAVALASGVPGNTRWLFRCDKPAVAFQKSSVKLANLVATVPGLGTAGLKSTPDTAAVTLVEDDPSVPWGTRLRGAELAIFRAFAGSRSMGAWLILVTDVVVHGSKDPIPPTAYRWTRQEVVTFVTCGMPPAGTSPCFDRFWKAADQIVLAAAGGQPRGQ